MEFLSKKKDSLFCDIEVYPNAFMIGLKSLNTQKVLQIKVFGESSSLKKEEVLKLNKYFYEYTIVSYNGEKYDIPMILKSLEGVTCKDLYDMSQKLIFSSSPGWLTIKNFNLKPLPYLSHIDLISVSPGVLTSLKTYGARLHTSKLQELPYDPTKHLTSEEFEEVCRYNVNDLNLTNELYNKLTENIELRYTLSNQFKFNFLCKSDAQIAETVFLTELKKKAGVVIEKAKTYKSVTYKAPDVIEFRNEKLKELLDLIKGTEFLIEKESGSPKLPSELNKGHIKINQTEYKFGLGGLHSKENMLIVKSSEDFKLCNVDVTSYYPSMILNYKFAPKGYEKVFLQVYLDLYQTRIKAKKEGREIFSKAYKLILNSLFGKFGSKYSKVYAPDLLLQVTITGQLLLFMLIERLESRGIMVVSANTDGLEYFCHKDKLDLAKCLIKEWELDTGMVMEFGSYQALYSRDVNNYLAVYENEIKCKGVFSKAGFKKNPTYEVVYDAVKQYLVNKTPLMETLKSEKSIENFLVVRNVKGGGIWRDKYLGKVVRWYYSVDGDPILYMSNKNKVAMSDKAKPMMDLEPKIPEDLDYDYYKDLAIKSVKAMGVKYVE